ncbi:MAG: rod shape-determining protein MreD [Myxococcales bacterium]|jgi:rod shape-determining protein MreD|nr:rod shape-determining protein MreD [Myxococcales bacterium]
MRNTAFLFAGLALLFLQSNLFRLTRLLEQGIGWLLVALHVTHGPVSIPGLVPSLVLPLILFMGVHEYSLARGAGVAFALGYVTDLLGIAPVGLYTFTYVAIFVLARSAGVRLAAQTRWMQMLLVLAFAFVESLIVLVLLAIFGRDAWVPRTLYPLTLPHVLITGLVSPLVFRIAARLHAATAGRERADIAGGES